MLESILIEDIEIVGRQVGPESGVPFRDLLVNEQYLECKLPSWTDSDCIYLPPCACVLWFRCAAPCGGFAGFPEAR